MCYFPIEAWLSKSKNKNGNRVPVFSISQALTDMPLKLPCGKCIGCRLRYSREWAIRMTHEAHFFQNNIFLTLTFNDENLLKRSNPHTIDVRDMQLFFKKFKKKFSGLEPVVNSDGSIHYPIRQFYCGEYGDKNFRPHYHAIVFNFDFPDKELWSVRDGYRLYRSPSLEKLWPYGFSTIGSFTFESAGYVARYVTKKINGTLAAKEDEQGLTHYEYLDSDTGEIYSRVPEFCNQSRMPGIGYDFYQKYKHYMFENDHVIINGDALQIPKYYNNLYKEDHPEKYLKVKGKRLASMLENKDDNTSRRLLDKYRIKQRQFSKLVRNL